MQFKLTMEQELIQKRARDFAQTEIEPIAAQVNRERKIPPDMTDKLVKAGFVGMLIPKKYDSSEAVENRDIMKHDEQERSPTHFWGSTESDGG